MPVAHRQLDELLGILNNYIGSGTMPDKVRAGHINSMLIELRGTQAARRNSSFRETILRLIELNKERMK